MLPVLKAREGAFIKLEKIVKPSISKNSWKEMLKYSAKRNESVKNINIHI